MAKKKKEEKTLSYLQMPLPSGVKYSKMTKLAFGGLNKRYTLDSGSLSVESNISTNEYPCLTPSEEKIPISDNYSNPISMFAFDDFLIVVYLDDDAIKLDYIKDNDYIYTGIIKTSGATEKDCVPRSIVQFNVYDTPTDPLSGNYVKKLLIFPDKVSMFMNIVEVLDNPESWDEDDLNTKDLSVMYCYDTGSKKYYYTVISEEDTEDGDENKVSYKRMLVKKHEYKKQVGDSETTVTVNNAFFCEGMEALVKEYKNSTPEIDESGATIYPPPETASHNCYYRNSYNNDIYRWCEYETAVEDDGKWIPDGGTAYGWKVSIPPAMPDLKYATVHLSRVFGVDDTRVYASGFNDYTNWNLDTIDEYNEANSWCSPSQSNTKAGGRFTGITTFQNHVICFKRDFMHEIYNTKNPFRLQDIYAEGTIDNRTIQDVDGKLIFASEDDVKIYTGSNPRIIGYNLNMPQYEYAVSGTDNRNYYLYCEDVLENKYFYVYDTFTDMWSEQSVEHKVLSFAHNKNGMYMLCEDGYIYQLDTGLYRQDWIFETDFITNQTVNIKHIKKLQMLVDIPEKINNKTNRGEDGEDANLQVYLLYDDKDFNEMEDDEKAKHLVYTSTKTGKFPIRVKPRQTANYGFKLHIEGSGYVKIYELEIFVEAGGDLYV